MHITPIETRPFLPPKDDLFAILDDALPAEIPEQSVLAVSSKVVAISEGRCELAPEDADVRKARKQEIARAESELYLERDERYPFSRLFTIVNGILMSTAGVDESNSNGYLTLWPKDPDASAAAIRKHIQHTLKVSEVGVVVTDAHSTPSRNGAIGMAIGHAGFAALTDYRETKDIFGREFEFERLNVADSLAIAANLVMGEGDECTPLALVTDVPHVTFTDASPVTDDPFLRLKVPLDGDVFAQFFQDHPWQRGGRHPDADSA